MSQLNRRRAFTLVELLVVIGIISMLIALLMPALARTREQSKAVKCMSNLRQIGMGLAMYSNDYRQRIPADVLYNTATDGLLWYQLLDGEKPATMVYISNKLVFSCPDMNDKTPGTYGMLHPQTYDPIRVPGLAINLRGMRSSSATDIGLVFDTALDESRTGSNSWFTDRSATNGKIWLAHSNAANGLFADWHVERCPAGRLKTSGNYNFNDFAGKKTGISWWFDGQLRVVNSPS